jgi:hypothetical protein
MLWSAVGAMRSCGKSTTAARPRLTVLENLDRLAPALALAVIDFAQVEHMALDDLAAGHALVFDDAPIVVRLAILEAFAAAQKHDGTGLWTFFGPWEQGRSALQPLLAFFAEACADFERLP